MYHGYQSWVDKIYKVKNPSFLWNFTSILLLEHGHITNRMTINDEVGGSLWLKMF